MQLQIRDLVVARAGRRIIEGLSFELTSGEALLLTGRNGAGKTTLIRTLAGYLEAQSGTIALHGWDRDRDLREACHYVGHLDSNKASLTVLENLRFWQAYLGHAEQAAAARDDRLWLALDKFEIDPLADIPAGYLSAGQKRRLGLARLLVAERPVWLLDEPTVSLDARSTGLLARLIDAHVAGGGLVVAATHLPLGLIKSGELRLGDEVKAAAAGRAAP
ncbi:MAG TPA: heme ABC exporter ATP-binding protein CcmA [Hyphomicrobiaceae bacterium]|nr:heme ABC exporter ATP-binding protein CcmA [Hyphomicrobiaceae bacterium]